MELSQSFLRHFAYDHLAEPLQSVSRQYYMLAEYTINTLPDSAERQTSLRKLLEAKDCAVRAALDSVFVTCRASNRWLFLPRNPEGFTFDDILLAYDWDIDHWPRTSIKVEYPNREATVFLRYSKSSIAAGYPSEQAKAEKLRCKPRTILTIIYEGDEVKPHLEAPWTKYLVECPRLKYHHEQEAVSPAQAVELFMQHVDEQGEYDVEGFCLNNRDYQDEEAVFVKVTGEAAYMKHVVTRNPTFNYTISQGEKVAISFTKKKERKNTPT